MATKSVIEIIESEIRDIDNSDSFICRDCKEPLSEEEHSWGWKLCEDCGGSNLPDFHEVRNNFKSVEYSDNVEE